MITRFAPSPTGPLHLGHAYSAILAHDMARAAGGSFLLRIEDIDQTRSRPHWEDQILEDLTWLGLTWDGPIVRQSEHIEIYWETIRTLWQRGLVYPCTCNRRDIVAAASAPQEGVDPTVGPDGLVYPGTCRTKDARRAPEPPEHMTLRLDMARALANLKTPVAFRETGIEQKAIEVSHRAMIESVGDIVLSRKDFVGSYHLSVVLDDASQGVTDVIRGADLFEATAIHAVLQSLLNLPVPSYHHHRLIRDDAGKRLAKRDDARAIAKFRQDGSTPQDIRALVGL